MGFSGAALLLVSGLGGLLGCAPSLAERSQAVDVRSVDDVIAQPERYLGAHDHGPGGG